MNFQSIAKLLVATLILYFLSYKQEIKAQNSNQAWQWWQESPQHSKFVGVGLKQFIENSISKSFSAPIIIAVLDTGLDTAHAIIQPYLWRNKKEISNNGKDDDQNGYTDDVAGWNFLGGTSQNLIYAQPEAVREYVRLKTKMENSDVSLSKSEQILWQEIESKYQRDKGANEKKLKEYRETLFQYQQVDETLTTVTRLLLNHFKDSIISYHQIKEWNPVNDSLSTAKAISISIMEAVDTSLPILAIKKEFENAIQELKTTVSNYEIAVSLYNTDINFRQAIGDDANNWSTNYGNNQLKDENGHGTSVAGIICVGIDACYRHGIKPNITIMPVRIVPSGGDEYDKDVANGIRYAVDNGAKIINLSFGKYYSPNVKWVEEAISYGVTKGVLFVHAAGNEGFDLDVKNHFPVPPSSATNNWIEVGASGKTADENLLASFSNYGRKTVDVFAPGVELLCPAPNMQWQISQGTSLAAPIVSLCAALLWAQQPNATANQIKSMLVSKVNTYQTHVFVPKAKKNFKFNQLSKKGGVINIAQR
ncbi:MAG: S8 family serine peptidase [Cyclobacteriaceae bacterium]|nr:S8 family serine peptidase [Cyclobacteriaceae bacterium]